MNPNCPANQIDGRIVKFRAYGLIGEGILCADVNAIDDTVAIMVKCETVGRDASGSLLRGVGHLQLDQDLCDSIRINGEKLFVGFEPQ